MSYEGYVEKLCANGHLVIHDAYQDVDTSCHCGAAFVFRHDVDETNGLVLDDPRTKPYPFEVAVEPEFIVCSLGYKHYTTERVYKIPEVKNDGTT